MSFLELPRPYPSRTYVRDEGEASTWVRRAEEPPQIEYSNGGTCEYLVTGEQSAGRFGLYRWTFGESESGPDPHFHRTISEHFYVLSGEVRIYDGREWVRVRTGDYVHVPEGGVHGFRGGERASMLLSFAPGGPREGYFETLANGVSMTGPERDEFMQLHDTHWV